MKACLPGVILTLLAATSASPTSAQQSLIPAQSEIAFTSTQMGVPVHGKFKSFNAQVAFDPKKLETSKIAFTIDVGSVSLGVAELDAEVAKPAWFDAKRFPQATYQSITVKEAGNGKFDVVGKLTIKGAVRDLAVPVAIAQTTAGTNATGVFVIKRLDFGIGDGDWKDTSLVSNEVQVKFKLLLAGTAAK
jgi:polyisoprenoid-binding protein YceI